MSAHYTFTTAKPTRFFASIGSAILLLLASTAAMAQGHDAPIKTPDRDTNLHFLFELRVGPYVPRVDSEPSLGGRKPYQETFGTMSRAVAQVEVDWQALYSKKVGSLGIGASVGYTEMSDSAFVVGTRTRADETTTLAILPGFIAAVGRLDILARELRIPIIPFAKAGIGYGYWRATTSNGLSQVGGVSGTGLSLGPYLGGGFALELDGFDRNSAKSLQASGIEHAHLSAEAYVSQLGLFGSPMRVGNNGFIFGLGFSL
jgi:hypothetical protein